MRGVPRDTRLTTCLSSRRCHIHQSLDSCLRAETVYFTMPIPQQSRLSLKRRADSDSVSVDESRPVPKKHKSHHDTPGRGLPIAGFWDRLSRVQLSRQALREFDRRTRLTSDTSAPLAPTARNPLRGSRSIQLKRLAQRGGPSLTHIRGVGWIYSLTVWLDDADVSIIVRSPCGHHELLEHVEPQPQATGGLQPRLGPHSIDRRHQDDKDHTLQRPVRAGAQRRGRVPGGTRLRQRRHSNPGQSGRHSASASPGESLSVPVSVCRGGLQEVQAHQCASTRRASHDANRLGRHWRCQRPTFQDRDGC